MFEKKKSVWLFLLPGLAMLMIFYIVPFFSGIGYSLTDGSYKNAFVGLQNYRDLWGNSMFLLGLKNTMELSLICAPLLWVLSFLLASALSAIKPFGGFFRSSVLMPYLTPSSAILLVWLVIFDYGGPVNRMLEAMGMERVMWLTSGALRLPVVLMFLWKNLGFCLIIFLAALQNISADLYEAAYIDGAGTIRTFFQVSFPMAMPGIMVATLYTFLGSMEEAQGTLLVGLARIKTMPVEMYGIILDYPGQAGAVFAILLMIPAAVMILAMKKYIGPEAIAGGFKMK